MLSTWTDLTAMTYMVPLVISALTVMIWGVADDLASHAGLRCVECGARFENESALKRHLKGVKAVKEVKEAQEAGRPEFKKAA
ncbi:MAG: hypothetical protein HY889_05930 [Deltaproteobacteria bacterium]|nr:hypothetical protein [Deltaproteobacteria bacterium]